MNYLIPALLSGFLFCCSCGRGKHTGITMTEKYLEAPFSLVNGLQIDEIRVDSFSKDHLPYVFYLKESWALVRNPDRSNNQLIKNLVFFDRPNENYYWKNDSTWGLFNISVTKYKYRGNISGRDRFDQSYQRRAEVLPVRFKPETWYLVDFIPPEVGKKHHEFLFVDRDMNFRFTRLRE